MSNFTQEIGFWNWFSMTTSEIDLNFKWAISLFLHKISSIVTVVTIKIWWHQPSCNQFPKALPASSMLILSRKSDVCLAFLFCQEQGYHQFQFKSHHMKGKKSLKNSICKCHSDLLLPLCSEMEGNYFRVSSTVYDELRNYAEFNQSFSA